MKEWLEPILLACHLIQPTIEIIDEILKVLVHSAFHLRFEIEVLVVGHLFRYGVVGHIVLVILEGKRHCEEELQIVLVVVSVKISKVELFAITYIFRKTILAIVGCRKRVVILAYKVEYTQCRKELYYMGIILLRVPTF